MAEKNTALWNRELDEPTPLVSALRAGGSWVCLGWHAQQASLGYALHHAGPAMEEGTKMARNLRAILPGKARNPLPGFILEELKEWERNLPTGQLEARRVAAGRRQEGTDVVSESIGESHWGRAFEEACRDFSPLQESDYRPLLAPVWQLLEGIRRKALAELDGRSRMAWELGEAIQGGCCPRRVFRALYEQEQGPKETLAALRTAEDAYLFLENFRAHIPALQQTVNYLNRQGVDPGALPPDDAWAEQVLERWAALEMPEEPPQELRDASGEAQGDDIPGLVGRVAEPAERGLAALEPRRRFVRDKAAERRDKWIYAQCLKGVLHKEIIAMLKKEIELQERRKHQTGKGEVWGMIETNQGIRDRAQKYAKDNDLPMPPSRQTK
jgi:hypothetical protein